MPQSLVEKIPERYLATCYAEKIGAEVQNGQVIVVAAIIALASILAAAPRLPGIVGNRRLSCRW